MILLICLFCRLMIFLICSVRVVFLRLFYKFVRFAFGDCFINLFGSGTAISRQTILLFGSVRAR